MSGAFSDLGRLLRPPTEQLGRRVIRLLRRWTTVRRERLELAELDDRLLRDIGIDRMTALREADRPFWDCRERSRQEWR